MTAGDFYCGVTLGMNCVDMFRRRPHYMERLCSAATDDA